MVLKLFKITLENFTNSHNDEVSLSEWILILYRTLKQQSNELKNLLPFIVLKNNRKIHVP